MSETGPNEDKMSTPPEEETATGPDEDKMSTPPEEETATGPDEDRIAKQGFVVKRVQKMMADGPLDAVVIGSGMAGLTSAAMLSLAGWKVLVLEQHDVAGGTTHAFTMKKKYEFDTGLHYVGAGVADSPVLKAISGGKLRFTEQEPESGVYDVATNGTEFISMTKGHPALTERLCKDYPDEAVAIKRYFGEIQSWKKVIALLCAAKMMPSSSMMGSAIVSLLVFLWALGAASSTPLLWIGAVLLLLAMSAEPVVWMIYGRIASVSTLERMRTIGLSEKMIGILTYNWGDYGTLPSSSPFFVQSVHMDHWNEGGFYPTGGPSEIAKAIIPTIEAAGGAVLVRGAVDQIDLDTSGRVCGVTVKGFSIPTQVVISATGAQGTFSKLLRTATSLPPAVSEMRTLMSQCAENRKGGAPSCTMASLFVALEGDNADLPASNLWMMKTWDHQKNMDDLMAHDSLDDIPEGGLAGGFLAFPSRKDAAWTERWPNCTVCEILVPVKFDWFGHWDGTRIHARGKDYAGMKERFSEKLLKECLYKFFPQTEGKVVFHELGTPLSNNFYFRTQDGEVYGLDHSMERFSPKMQKMLSASTQVPGLYLSGQDTLINGIMGAMMSGVISVMAVSKLALLKSITKVIQRA